MTRVVAFLQPRMADWEAGPVLAMLATHLGAQVLVATPEGAPITSCGRLRVKSDVAFDKVAPEDADAFLLIGSDAWTTYHDTPFFWLLQGAAAQGKVIGAICAGTVAAARAGLFEDRQHTSNDRAWLQAQAPGYPGAGEYVESPRAVVHGNIVSAPGSAPGTFAAGVARLLAPDQDDEIDAFEDLCAREWTAEAQNAPS